ncbi:MAG: hypothetical protein KJ738_07750 [Actinobacteria bacterium]|nr:hypothetical protein [Propionicimonas sp.]MBU3976740.1 hypothetical protein [Actinomycetota bacterium]MBU3986835.1 hypothetical protein [Actinomycetota bacterium]MBU4006747.1 hypothetical protein [Actinomycetota bacterium]MBU4065447.1 hypothetical protein [Actinomycetota bacterium]
MQRLSVVLATGAITLVALSGCASPGGQMSPTPAEGRPPFLTSAPANPSGAAMTPSDAQLAAITADLKQRGVTGTFTVLKAVSITWNDGSLGCPEPGKFYTQALVPGAQIVVSVGDQRYDYRFGGGSTPKLCENGK